MLAYAYDVLTEVSAPVGRDAGGGRREAEGKKQVDEVDSMWNKVWLEAGRFSIALG